MPSDPIQGLQGMLGGGAMTDAFGKSAGTEGIDADLLDEEDGLGGMVGEEQEEVAGDGVSLPTLVYFVAFVFVAVTWSHCHCHAVTLPVVTLGWSLTVAAPVTRRPQLSQHRCHCLPAATGSGSTDGRSVTGARLR